MLPPELQSIGTHASGVLHTIDLCNQEHARGVRTFTLPSAKRLPA